MPVQITATYHTDRTRYEYFRDEACGVGGMLGVSYTTATGDESVRAFQDRLNAHCKRRGMNYCADSVPMTAEVAIVREPGGSTSGLHATGEFTVDIRRIIDYRIQGKTGP